ncbi:MULTISPECIES: peptide deformylase [Deefgea]|uniref:Peptide deformylase n=1 Tax=Deefgea chitinilytica TaxID=570276 RepID=A0ABS2CE27_9NEIS|nr:MULTISPECIES: peptide deformylase [Deefgea]MBM5572402.1 peptide deformylase [Deefgea chitinilytica]MBM9889638.1 peptide deformylase [Deefgea sp. CFH1-16]
MPIRPVLKMGEPLLLAKAAPVTEFDTPELHALIVDLFDTMIATHGVGIAAPQIGVSLQVVVFGFEQNERYPDADVVPQTILLNPVITPLDEAMESGWEGCLSVPGLRGLVPRYTQIRYQGFDQFGTPIDRTVSGFHARVVQHECDHLFAVLYPQRITDMTQFGYTDVLFPQLKAGQDE